MKGKLDPEYQEKILGEAIIRETFRSFKSGNYWWIYGYQWGKAYACIQVFVLSVMVLSFLMVN